MSKYTRFQQRGMCFYIVVFQSGDSIPWHLCHPGSLSRSCRAHSGLDSAEGRREAVNDLDENDGM